MADRDWRCEDPKQQLTWAAATSEVMRVLEGKWKIVIIFQLFAAKSPPRFSELERRVEGVNQKMLIQQLRELERDGIVTRRIYAEVPPRVEYALSEIGLALGPSMEALTDWTFMRREVMEHTAKAAARPDNPPIVCQADRRLAIASVKTLSIQGGPARRCHPGQDPAVAGCHRTGLVLRDYAGL
jgi:DNA-binding HxlR family transcriptional regulator